MKSYFYSLFLFMPLFCLTVLGNQEGFPKDLLEEYAQEQYGDSRPEGFCPLDLHHNWFVQAGFKYIGTCHDLTIFEARYPSIQLNTAIKSKNYNGKQEYICTFYIPDDFDRALLRQLRKDEDISIQLPKKVLPCI